MSIVFYGSTSMLFLGAFIMRYRLELIAAFPFVAWVMAVYLSLAFRPNSAAQNPESLYKERGLMQAMIAVTIVMVVCLMMDIPVLHTLFSPTAPTTKGGH